MRLAGKRFTEFGQPINQPLKFFPSARLIRGLGCDVELVEGAGHYLRMPHTEHGYLRLGFLERPHRLTKWFGIDRTVVATKRQPGSARRVSIPRIRRRRVASSGPYPVQ